MLQLMIEKFVERKRQISDARVGRLPISSANPGGDKMVSDTALFVELGNKLKVVKHGD